MIKSPFVVVDIIIIIIIIIYIFFSIKLETTIWPLGCDTLWFVGLGSTEGRHKKVWKT